MSYNQLELFEIYWKQLETAEIAAKIIWKQLQSAKTNWTTSSLKEFELVGV